MKNTSKTTGAIRNHIYLDSQKLRSLSSQLFEGVTEYVLKNETTEGKKEDSQKGPVGSGQVLADIFSRRDSSTELRFLEDHAYALFEDQLRSSDKITLISAPTSTTSFDNPFVLVTGQLTLHDVKDIVHVVESFNDIGEAMYRVTNRPDLAKGLHGKQLSDAEVRAKAREQNLQMDVKFSKALQTMLSFGYQDLLEAQIPIGSTLFSAPLKRDSLRESEQMLVQKYSRRSQIDFSLFGIVTQIGKQELDPPTGSVGESSNLKEAMRYMVSHMQTLESTFTGTQANEIVIDPVAIYMSL